MAHPKTNKEMMPNSPGDRKLIPHHTALTLATENNAHKVIQLRGLLVLVRMTVRDVECLGFRPDARDCRLVSEEYHSVLCNTAEHYADRRAITNFGSLLMLAINCSRIFRWVVWVATKGLSFFLQESPIR